jgi:DNA-binding NarL/FixJ family response regulator
MTPTPAEASDAASTIDLTASAHGPVHRVLIVDDHPELRMLLRIRLDFEPDIDVIGEASNGVEAVQLTKLLAPSAVVLDLDMPGMRGEEAIPLMRAAAPGMGILVWTADQFPNLAEGAAPDAMIQKGESLEVVIGALRDILDQGPFDIMRLQLRSLPLKQAITAFDTWTGLNVRVLEALHRKEELVSGQLGGATPEQLAALTGVYAHIGANLQKAAHDGAARVSPVIHVFRSTGVLARGALLALNSHGLPGFWRAWDYEVPAPAMDALALVRDRLMEVLPASTGAEETAVAHASQLVSAHSTSG